jgi:hypothetical protein
MAPDDLMQWAKAAAVSGGVVVGVFAVFSPSYVWLKKQVFGWAGVVLCGFGTILIVASIFHNVTFLANLNGLEFRLAELQAQVVETRKLAATTNQELAHIAAAQGNQVSGAQLAKLQKDIEQLGFKVTQIGSTSEAALAGLRNIDAKIRTVPFNEEPQPQKKPQGAPSDFQPVPAR